MLIDKVEALVLSQPLEESFYFSQHRYDSRTVCLIRITLDNGLVGWGEGYGPATVIKAGVEFLAPLLLGKDPLHVEALWQVMHRRVLDYARRGVFVAAISALDVALWDLKGKRFGEPIHRLLGGKRHDRIRAYASILLGRDGAETADVGRRYVEVERRRRCRVPH